MSIYGQPSAGTQINCTIYKCNRSIAAQNNVRCEQPRQTWTFNSARPITRVQLERIKHGQENEVLTVASIKAVTLCSSI